MMKQLSLTVALVLAAGCKTDSPSPSSTGSSPATAGPPGRSAKIDVKPVPPAPPSLAETPDESSPGEDQVHDRRLRNVRAGGRRAKLDTNGDGVVSDEERAAALQERMTAMRTRLDTDGDGKLSPSELANARGRMRFDDPAALDTNHDGDISSDELAAGFKAKREQWRANLGSGAPPAPDSEPAPRGQAQ
jgi:hypothetical protein